MRNFILKMILVITLCSKYGSAQITQWNLSSSLGLVKSLKCGAGNDVWVKRSPYGILKTNYTGTAAWWHKIDNTNGLRGTIVLDYCPGYANSAWVLTDSSVFKIEDTIVMEVAHPASVDGHGRAICFAGSQIWIGTDSLGLFLFQNNNWQIFDSSNSPITTIHSIVKLSSGKICVMSLDGVAYLFDGTTWQQIFSNVLYNYSFSDRNDGVYLSNGSSFHYFNSVSGLDSIVEGPDICEIPRSVNINMDQWANYYNDVLIPMDDYLMQYNKTNYKDFVIHNKGSQPLVSTDIDNRIYLSHYGTNTIFVLGGGYYYQFPQVCANPVNPNTCKKLSLNNISTPILNQGDLNWDITNAGFCAPKGSGKVSIFASALWIGGLDNNNVLHQAAMTYRQRGYDYWPGPLDTINGSTNLTVSSNYNKLWKVNRKDIEEMKWAFQNGYLQLGWYTPPKDIVTWPGKGSGNYSRHLAPFYDYDGDGNYNVNKGDYPLIKGDQAVFTIFNDRLNPHGETGGERLGVEVHLMAYEYFCDSLNESGDKILNNAVFCNYKIYNRSNNNYHNVKIGFWQDVDLGNYQDDFVGCNPSGNYGYAYNGDSLDDGTAGYGSNPPIINTLILNGPKANVNDGIDNNNNGIIDEVNEKNLMTSFQYYNNDYSPAGNPMNAQQYYNYLNSIWKDNSQVMFGGTGYGPNGNTSNIPYPFMFPGTVNDPNSSLNGLNWSEMIEGNIPSDRRYLLGCGPFDLPAKGMVEYDMANIFVWDTTITWNTAPYWENNHSQVMKIKDWYDAQNFPSCIEMNLSAKGQTIIHSDISIFPNPATNQLNISGLNTFQNSTYKIFDISGKCVQEGVLKETISVTTQAEGLYLLQINNENTTINKKFIKQ